MSLIPGTNVPSSITGTGTIERSNGVLSGHIFNAGLEKPDILPALIIKYPQYYLTSLTEKIGSTRQDLMSSVHSWQVMGRTRKSANITAVANGTTATATLTTDIAYDVANDNLGYFQVGDTIYCTNSSARGRIVAISGAGGFQTIDVVRTVGGNWSTALINTGFRIGHVGTLFAEGSVGSGGTRSYLPDSDWNVTSILRRGFKVTADMIEQKTYVDDKSWYFKQEDFEHKEFMRDIEATMVFGSRFKSASLQGINSSRGILESAELSGKQVTFSSSIGVQESDIVYLIQQLLPEAGSNDIILLCGEVLLVQLQQALGNNYRSIPTSEQPRSLAGLGFQSYEVAGRKIHFAYYELFSDDTVVPQVTASSTAKDFRNFGLALDFGTVTGGENNIEVLYRNGRKFVQKWISGMASPEATVSSAYDGLQGELLTEFMPVVHLPNRLGLLFANS